MRKILLSAIFVLLLTQVWSQTPGLIIKPALSPGNSVLDPDLDGYVSQKTDGIQQGFTIPPDNDVYQSEIPYVAIIRPDPQPDILRGPKGGFIEIVGIDAAGNNAILTYNDGTNLLIRFRLGGFAPNSKSYSLMIDTDQKFGFTGVNADTNAITGNPGFEAEIVLETNFNVKAYNVDGTLSGTQVGSDYSYDYYCQKSIAISDAGGDPDYFYDFYIPISDISSLFSSSTPLRIVAITVMNPHPAIGNNALSDVGGVTTGGNLDDQFIDLIDEQTPTLPGEEVLDRSACPEINPVSINSTTISGTSSEAVGTTISVSIYQSDSTSIIAIGTTQTISASPYPTWSVNIFALSGMVTLPAGFVVKASATAVGKGESFDDCDIETVTDCAGPTGNSGVTLTYIKGGKGYTIANSFPSGTIFTWYNADYTQAHYPVKSGSSTYIVNPQTSAIANETMTFSTETGQTFPDGVFYFTFQEPEKCVSAYLPDCQYSAAGTSVAPVITNSIITKDSTIVRGTCGASANTRVSLFADGVFLKSTTVVSSSNWTISGLNLSNYDCDTITASATDAGMCPTNSVSGVQIKHPGLQPSITSTGCSVSPPASISGFSSEADGTTITLYDTNPTRTPIGTAIVSGGVWTASPISTSFGDIIVASVTDGDCLSIGPDSNPITISTQTDISDFTISVEPVTEGDDEIKGDISGTLPVTLNLYTDDTPIASAVVSASPWTIGGLTSIDIYIGGKIKATVTSGINCESDTTSVLGTIQCLPPDEPDYTGGSYTYCVGGAGSITLTTSQSGVVYQLVNGFGTAVGPASIGIGGPITLYTYAITTDLLDVYVKAYKIGYPSCSATSSNPNDIDFDLELPTPSVDFSTTSLYVIKGTTSVELPFTDKSESPSADTYTVSYPLSARNQGFSNVTSPGSIPDAPDHISLDVPGSALVGTYNGTITIDSDESGVTCTRSYGFTITLIPTNALPVITSQPSGKNICSGDQTVLAVSSLNATGYQWQSSSSYSGFYENITGANSSNYVASPTITTYYKVLVSNATGTTPSSTVSVTVNSAPVLSGAIAGLTPVCAGAIADYSITANPGATSYTWSYSGSNVTITPDLNEASLTFAENATSGTLSVYGNNSCGNGTPVTLDITVNKTPFISNMATSGCIFDGTPVNGVNGIVPPGTTFSWSAPDVTGGVTGGSTGTDQSTIKDTLANPTSSIQTAIYTVTPKLGGCTGNSFTLTVSVGPGITISADTTNLLCYGATTGSINITVTGGTPGYTYSWDDGPTTQNRSGLSAAIYEITVTDTKGCTSVALPEVTQPDDILILVDTTSVICFGNADGAIDLTVSGGTGSYTYEWNNGSTDKDRIGLIAGTYSVIVADSNNCPKSSGDIVVDEPELLEISGVVTNVKCYNESNGEIDITVKGGIEPYTYNWNDLSLPAEPDDRTGLSAGNYSFTVTDANGCITTKSFTVTQPALLSLSSSITHPTCSPSASINNSNGAIAITVNGGTGLFTYDWNDLTPSPVEPEDRTDIENGTYTLKVTDSKGCEVSSSFTLININPDPVTPGAITK